ncbi:MAG: DUF2625 family protein [Kineosporiaceae bacterium]
MNEARPPLRTPAELAAVDAPAWPSLWVALTGARVPVRVLDVDPGAAESELHLLQVDAGTVLGALVLHTGGLLVDHGWVRVLGGGAQGLPGVAGASGLLQPGAAPPWLVVGYDVVGGRFAIAGQGAPAPVGEVCYWGPDTLRWDSLGVGHRAFVLAAVDGALADLYEPYRWPGWQDDVSALTPGQGLALYPPPFTRDGQDPSCVARRTVAFPDLLAFYDDMAAQLASGPEPDGGED